MPVLNTQKLSFLGGLVSPSLHYRSDLEKFGKWFSKADNIRFSTIGGLENRFGTIHVANTKENVSGQIIKLVKFVYNSNESCLLELGTNYCRVYKDTTYKTEFYTEINPNTDGDIKYTQSGDIIFIATTKGFYEIIRLSKDFTSWEFRKFNWDKDIMPLDEENDDDTKTISLTTTSNPTQYIINLNQNEDNDAETLYNPKVTFTIGGQDTIIYQYTSGRITYSDFVTALNALISSYNLEASIVGNSLLFDIDTSTTVESIKLDYSLYIDMNQSISFNSLSAFFWFPRTTDKLYKCTIEDLTINVSVTPTTNIVDMANNINSQSDSLHRVVCLPNGDYYVLNAEVYSDYWGKFVSAGGIAYFYRLVEYQAISESSPLINFYIAQTSFNFFSNKLSNETFAIRNTVDASNIRASYDGTNIQYSLNNGTNTTTVQTFLSDGNWRYNSSGLWNGVVNLYYSKDKGNTWTKFFTRSNDGSTSSSVTSGYSTVNDNTSGVIETDDLILLKIEASITWQNSSSKFMAELACKQFDVNSYYKIYTITDEDTATVYCIKNDVGELTNMDSWRESAFSLSKSYPTAIGFYQNRLFLGKDYTLYGSETDDFWNFYEPTTVKDSDPITMSLLGYQVDTIQNILTMRSFFVFTTGGEFGLGSEGALTQADKYLKQLSAHGSNECNPIFCGDIVVFVDSSGNTVRAFKYALDVDGYEATDISVLIEQILKGKTIKTTEYLKHSKECLFLTTDGEIYVFKFYQEQNIAAWSKWKHAKYNITNLCVVPSSNNTEILYIAMDTTKGEKVIEKFEEGLYQDSTHTYTSELYTNSFVTDFEENDIVVVNDGIDSNYLVTVGENGVIETRNETLSVTVGLRYISEATLLSPEIQLQDGVFTTFNKKRPFRVHLIYNNSYGFKVGVEDEDNQEVQYQDINAFIDEEDNLVSGKSNVLVPARFDGNSRVTFVQELPYPMHIENVLIETDYGGK